MQWVSKIFPFTFYTDIFVDQMLRGTPWVYSLPDHGIYDALHCLTAPLPAASAKGLHGGKILGEVIA